VRLQGNVAAASIQLAGHAQACTHSSMMLFAQIAVASAHLSVSFSESGASLPCICRKSLLDADLSSRPTQHNTNAFSPHPYYITLQQLLLVGSGSISCCGGSPACFFLRVRCPALYLQEVPVGCRLVEQANTTQHECVFTTPLLHYITAAVVGRFW
jgi:hypothetical protein